MHRESAYKRAAEHVTHKTPGLLRYGAHFWGLCCDEQPRKTALESINTEKTLTVPEVLFCRESADFNARLHGKHGDQAALHPGASAPGPTVLLREYAHRFVRGAKSKGNGTPRTNGDGSRPGCDAD
jgi:hypothetical protein